jgi:glycosyltransferase involved in cell wall biosynthesis
MACGAPVITSNTSSMPEIAGDAAFIINPYKTEEITEAMVRVTSDETLRKNLTTKGIPQAAKFSWRSMAEHTLAIYQEIGKHTR